MRRINLFLPALLLLGIVSHSFAQFLYQPDKIKVGTVYHYLKTNIDGSKEEHVSLYVAAKDSIVAFKFHPGAERAGLVSAKMDWSTFSATRLESWQVFGTGERKLFATLQYLPAEKSVAVEIPAMGLPTIKAEIKYLPFHVYNFDLSSLNLAFRHLSAPEKSFTIGLADPTWAEQGPLFAYKGEVEVNFLGEEKRGEALCRKYAINGTGLQNRGGIIWVDKNGEHFVDVEIALPDNPDWQSFKLRLQSVGQMNQGAWEAFMEDQF